jgi:hypothetical protein
LTGKTVATASRQWACCLAVADALGASRADGLLDQTPIGGRENITRGRRR